MSRRGPRKADDQVWQAAFAVGEKYEIDLIGVDRAIVESGEYRQTDAFRASTLPEELARIVDEEGALAFARRNGVLAFRPWEPVAFVFHEARKARLLFALLSALEAAHGDDHDPALEAALATLIGAKSIDAFRGRWNTFPTWRHYPGYPPPARSDSYWGGQVETGAAGEIARAVISDVLNGPYEVPPAIAPEFRGMLERGRIGVPIVRTVRAQAGRLVLVQSAMSLIDVIRWWFQEEIRAGRSVRQCQWCKNYFFVYDGRQRYCRRPAGDPDPEGESLCATAARGKRFRGRRAP